MATRSASSSESGAAAEAAAAAAAAGAAAAEDALSSEETGTLDGCTAGAETARGSTGAGEDARCGLTDRDRLRCRPASRYVTTCPCRPLHPDKDSGRRACL